MAGSFVKFQRSYIKDVLKDINKKDAQLRRKAANHIKRRVAGKLQETYGTSAPGEPPGLQTGKLLEGLKVRSGAYVAYVGFGKPGFHATALEFGGKSTDRKTKDGKSRGYMAPRPVLFPTITFSS